MKTRILMYSIVLFGLAVAASAAAPTIKWQLTYPAPDPNAKRLVKEYTWYEIRAEASDTDGNLAEIKIFRDGQAFAFAGGGNGWTNNWGGFNNDAPRPLPKTAADKFRRLSIG
jgi:hypothetical protein